MSRRYKFFDNSALYFVSYATVSWVDLFIRDLYREIILKSLQHCIENKGLEVYAFCIMTSHVHLIISTHGDKLENIMRDHKQHTSEMLRKAPKEHYGESRREWMMQLFLAAGEDNGNNRGFQLWQQHNQPIGLTTADMLYLRLSYLLQNPVEAGFVESAEDWKWSSARDYCNGRVGELLKGLTLLDPDTGVR